MTLIPERTIERLCAYRRILFRWSEQGKERFHSRELAEEAGITSDQVRRDMMSLKTIGTPKNGYLTQNIIDELGLIIEGEAGQNVVLVGAGHLGNAIVSYFNGRRPDLKIVATFDNDLDKIGQTVGGIRCHSLSDLARTVRDQNVLLGILTVPGDVAQEMATFLIEAGVRAIINFTPIKLKVPAGVYVEDVDILVALEKSAYFARMFVKSCEEEAAKREGRDVVPDAPRSTKRVLCIDDDRDVVDSYRAILSGAGYDVETAFDGAAGLRKATQYKPDLIILDLMMGDAKEGMRVAAKLRRDPELQFVPILVLTAVSSASDAAFGGEDGAALPVDAFVHKPVAPYTLLSSIRRLLSLTRDQINVDGGSDVRPATQLLETKGS